jgi:hypothetical protein
MKLSGSRFTMGLTGLLVGAASVVLAIGGGDHAVAGAASSPPPATGVTAGAFQVVVQTMDSCRSGLQGATYEIDDANGHLVATAGTKSATNSPGSIGGNTCVVQQGDCATTSKGCTVFAALPAGDYRLKETWTPVKSNTNPDGYAPCNGGSACRWQTADITINNDGSILGLVTNIAPNGQVQQFPRDPAHTQYFAGTPSDPIVFHDFGLCKSGNCPTGGNPTAVPPIPGTPNTCDGDADADDWITGTHSSTCGYLPEANEATACATPVQYLQNTAWNGAGFPWQCESNQALPLHLTGVTLSGPTTVNALSTFQVAIGGSGTTPTLVSAQDPGLVAVPTAGGFAVSLSPVRTQGGQITTGAVTITAQGGGGKLIVNVLQPTANSNYIENLYHDVLGRYGAPDEIGYWSSRMDGGMTAGDVASTFSMTPEFLGSLVDTDYQWMVGSKPAVNDPGRQYWVNFLSQGNRLDTMTGMLGASDAYYAQAGGTDAGFINSLYAKVLHRPAPPAASEVAYWSQFGPFAHNSMARLQVANDMAFSHEQHMLIVSGWYQKFLGRAPESAGLTYWADRLDTGTLPQVLVPSFTNGPEYYGLKAKY